MHKGRNRTQFLLINVLVYERACIVGIITIHFLQRYKWNNIIGIACCLKVSGLLSGTPVSTTNKTDFLNIAEIFV